MLDARIPCGRFGKRSCDGVCCRHIDGHVGQGHGAHGRGGGIFVAHLDLCESLNRIEDGSDQGRRDRRRLDKKVEPEKQRPDEVSRPQGGPNPVLQRSMIEEKPEGHNLEERQLSIN